MAKNLTEGNVLKSVVCFAIPYFISYFLQTLYGMADLFIIGQYDSVAAITAVAVGSQVMHMLTVMIVGLAMGATVGIAQAVGANKKERAAFNIGNTATLFMALSVALTAVLILSVRLIVHAMATPEQAVDGTARYLTICFLGIPFITAYNIIGSVFRGLGDSKTPMYFVTLACVVNIALDYLFIGLFGLSAAGAALGTVFSQAISVVAAIVVIRRRGTGISLKKRDFKVRRPVMGRLLKIGVPIALQDGFIQISFIVITIIANRRGLTDAAAVGIVEKIIGFLFLVPSSLLSTVSALGAQNIGAKKDKRAIQILFDAAAIAVVFGVSIVGCVQFESARAVGLFTADAATVAAGTLYLKGYVWDCLFAGIQFCFSGYFCACGKSHLSFLHNIIAIVFVRVPGAYWTSLTFPETLYPMGLSSAAGSLLSVFICAIAFAVITKNIISSTLNSA